MKLSKKTFLLLFIFLSSFSLHLFKINNFPPSLNWDEVSHGYNAFSILKTGRDQWGQFLPLIFRAYGDYKLPLYIYLTVPFVLIFGLNPLSVRLPSALAGALIPVYVYKITLHFSKNSYLSLLTAFITLLSPWSIFLSRIALEANLFCLLFLVSFYQLLRSKPLASANLYALSLFTYNSSRILLPFYLIALFLSLKKQKSWSKKKIIWLLPLLFAIIVFLVQSLNSTGQARYHWVSLLDSGAINRINELRAVYPRFLINKITYFIFTAAKNYLSHFNPRFLFASGGSHYQFNIPDFPLISPFFLPFLFFGLIFSFSHPWLLYFFLISVVPSAITRDAPHTLRSIIFLPLSSLLIGFGLQKFIKKAPKITLVLLVFILLYQQINFWSRYQQYTITYSQSWQYGYKQVVSLVKKNYQKYNHIIITKKYGEPHQFILFYWPWDPSVYQNDSAKIWDYHANWYWVDAFDKFQFINDWEITNLSPLPSTLLVTSPKNYPVGGQLLSTINFLDGSFAFDIISYE